MGFLSTVSSVYRATESGFTVVEKTAETLAIAATGAQIHSAVAIADSLPASKKIEACFEKLNGHGKYSMRLTA